MFVKRVATATHIVLCSGYWKQRPTRAADNNMVAPRFLLCWYMLVNGFALLLVESAADRRQQVETGSSVWTRTSAPQFGRRQALHPGSSLSPPRRMTCCLESPSNWLRKNNNSHKDSLQDSATFSIPRGGRRRVPHPQRWWNSLNFTGGRSMEQSSLSLVRLLLARLPRSGWITAAVATVAIVLGQRVVSSPAVRRAAYFWWHAGPIVAHYQWTHFWLQHVRRNTTTPAQRDHMYQQLHDRYAEPSLQLILNLQGLYCKLGQGTYPKKNTTFHVHLCNCKYSHGSLMRFFLCLIFFSFGSLSSSLLVVVVVTPLLSCSLVLSTRPDFVPPQYITRFSTVQDAIPQWPIDRIEKIVRDALQEHFNLAYEDVFQHMDAVALGSASIGQIHAATLTPEWADRLERSDTTANNHNNHKMRKHNYTRVAVKVMHRGAKQRFAHDCQVVRWLCRVAMPGWSQILDSFERRLMLEFDYCREARDMQEIRTNLLASPYDASIVCVPHPELQLCCPNVLVMELLDGTKLVNAIENGLTRAMGGDEKKAAAFLKEQQDQILWGDMKKNHQEDEEDDPVSGLAAIPVGGGGGGDPPRRRRRGRHGGLKVLLHSYGLVSVLKLGFLQRRYQKLVRLLLGVHGYQMFINGCYNGDPHPGACVNKQECAYCVICKGMPKISPTIRSCGLSRKLLGTCR